MFCGLRGETGLPVATFQKMFAYCVVCGMGSRVIALLGGAVTDFLPFRREKAPGGKAKKIKRKSSAK